MQERVWMVFCSRVMIALSCLLVWPSLAASSSMMVDSAPFGTTKNNQPVAVYTLRNAHGLTAKVLTYGAIIYSLEVPDRSGRLVNINANCASLDDYENKSPCFGAVIGRYANRIAGGQFTLDGQLVKVTRNAGPNHIHGGNRGFHKQVWTAEPLRGDNFVGVKLTYVSKDGEEGYPGTITCTVRYELSNDDEWKMDYAARSDKTTVVNLTNHSYWNLAGAEAGTVLDQLLTVDADKYLLADEALIPTGEIKSVEGTPVDFRQPHRLGQRMGEIKEKQFGGGYDHCLLVKHKTPGDMVLCAKVEDPTSGRTMEVFTTQPGVQIFTANYPSGAFSGPGGYAYPSHHGLCLETQHFPDSPNHPEFPSTVLKPGETFHETTVHKFGIQK